MCRLWSLCLLALALAVVTAAATESSRNEGRIVGVADGDTITLLDADKTQHRIRLDGIDAPERGQAFGNRSKQSLSDLAIRKDASAHCHKTDRYNRRVCVVIVDGRDVRLEQIRRGMAWHFKRYEGEQRPEAKASYAAVEIKARSERWGLWRDADPVAPWEWRAKRN